MHIWEKTAEQTRNMQAQLKPDNIIPLLISFHLNENAFIYSKSPNQMTFIATPKMVWSHSAINVSTEIVNRAMRKNKHLALIYNAEIWKFACHARNHLCASSVKWVACWWLSTEELDLNRTIKYYGSYLSALSITMNIFEMFSVHSNSQVQNSVIQFYCPPI